MKDETAEFYRLLFDVIDKQSSLDFHKKDDIDLVNENDIAQIRVARNTSVTSLVHCVVEHKDTLLADHTDLLQTTALVPFKLSNDQEEAWSKIQNWIQLSEPYFVLKGFAGTGKSTLMKLLLSLEMHYNFVFTAPTNKAAGELSRLIGRATSTIYSLLGIRMMPVEDKLELTYPESLPRISKGTIVVIDEAFMIGKKLLKFIKMLRKELDIRILFVGDPEQFNPIGESYSPVKKLDIHSNFKARLTQVMRFDNQILALSERIREYAREKRYDESPIFSDNKDGEGVFVYSNKGFEKRLLSMSQEEFADTKVIAWRNKTVDKYNKLIRDNLGYNGDYVNGEMLLLAEPIEEDERIVAHTDEEGVASQVKQVEAKIDDLHIPVWSMLFKTPKYARTLLVPIPGDDTLPRILNEKASNARAISHPYKRKLAWRDFFKLKKSFHPVRYNYALTGHRIQGTTLRGVFIDQDDMLANKNKREAYRGLYVAATRPRETVRTF